MQQQQQQRSTFYRANRPGNLNIINDSDSSIQQQQQIQTSYNQQPISAGYPSQYNNQTNYASTQQTNLNSPHYQIQQTQIQQNPISPSYHSYSQNQYQSSNVNYEQSFTPKYSPGPSSAHIVNKQNYFNFDVPAKLNTSQIPQSPNPGQIQNKYNQVPSSPHLSNQTKNLSISSNYNSQNRFQSQNYQPFSNSYQKPPHTPVSAVPYQSYTNVQTQNLNQSLSVPNSPIHPYHQNQHHIQNQHSVFQFNSNLNNNNKSSTNNNINNNINNNNNNNNNNINAVNVQNFNNFYRQNANTENNRRVVSGDSFEFNPGDVTANLDDLNQTNQNQTDTTDNLITSNTFGENDVEMVQEVINNMIQKEEITNSIKLSPDGYMLPSDSSSASNSASNTNPNSNLENNNFSENFDMNFESNSNIKDNQIDGLLDINNNNNNESNKNLNTDSNKKKNLDNLTSIANLLINNPQPNVNNESKPFAYSLSNLSEAASAEFLLNYGAENSKLKPKTVDNENDGLDKIKSYKKQQKILSKDMYSNSPQNFDDGYNLNTSLNETKPKPIDISMPQTSSSIQSCSDCGKVFTNKSALAKHKLIHSNERKYSCHLCDKSFKRQDHLNGHLLTHQDKKPFVCKAPGCDKSYCDSRSLKRHVESQHQDYLAQLANGNQDALNYLPSIGKIKANLAPNFQHEISVQDLIKTNKCDIKVSHPNQQYSPITPVPGQSEDAKMAANDINLNNQRPKNFFTFEEPKPETCKICGKGFKNIPALNGHMRLHGGFIKTKLGVKATSDLNNNDSNASQLQINSQHIQIGQPHSNSSLLFNDDSMSSNCSSNNSFSSSNLSSNAKNFHPFPQTSNHVQKSYQIPFNDSYLKQKPKDKIINEKEQNGFPSYNINQSNNNNNNNLNQVQYGQYNQYSDINKKINRQQKSIHDASEIIDQNINSPPNYLSNLFPQKPKNEFQSTNTNSIYNQRNLNFLESVHVKDSQVSYDKQPINNIEVPYSSHVNLEHKNEKTETTEATESNENDKNFELLSKQIYNITTALLNQQASYQAAAAAAAVKASMNPPSNQSNIIKPKPKPMPLVIPQDISAFQKNTNSYQKTNMPFYSQLSNSSYFSHIYPHATLLKSPRIFDNDVKKQYTPPPMLSPFRKGPGLFYNSKNLNLLMMPNLFNSKLPNFNHSNSFSYYPSSFNFSNNLNEVEENNEHQNELQEEQEIQKNEKLLEFKTKEEKLESGEIIEKSSKPSIMKRLQSQTSTGQTGSFFPDESISNEAIAASLIDDTLSTTPFINVGKEFQAFIPEFREKIDEEYLAKEEPEDLMWSSRVMQTIDGTQLTSYLDLICKSSLVFGSSNNLELGIHILNYFAGDIQKSIKAFLDDTINLPANHPITTYKYSETDIWTTNEIKKFETAILKHDKVFSEVSIEVETKTIKQCIEFYYLWKKVMSDGMKKKWKNLKKKRSFEDTIEQNLRSSSNGKTDISIDNETEDTSLKNNNENEFEDQLDELELVNSNCSKSYLKETQKNRIGVDENSKSRMSTPSPSQFLNNRYECDKCNQGFKTKRKLGQHIESKH